MYKFISNTTDKFLLEREYKDIYPVELVKFIPNKFCCYIILFLFLLVYVHLVDKKKSTSLIQEITLDRSRFTDSEGPSLTGDRELSGNLWTVYLSFLKNIIQSSSRKV